jgi:hypothetical protein
MLFPDGRFSAADETYLSRSAEAQKVRRSHQQAF